MTHLIRQVGLEVGGETGQRLLHYFRIHVSGDTVLRLLRRGEHQETTSPRVIGVDDWAFRKGRNYGTIIVDLEERRVIDLLPDRRAETLQEWLKDHPDIEFVARDRSSEYAAAIHAGCPDARQVADRWHLMSNARELAERYLKSVYADLGPFEVPSDKEHLFAARRPAFRRAKADKLRGVAMRQRHRDLYKRVQELRHQGLSIRKIALHLHIHRDTVKRYYAANAPPAPIRQKQRRSILDPYFPYLNTRLSEGCENAMQLWREIVQQGYPGTHRQVQRWLQQQRSRPAPTTPHVYRDNVSQRGISCGVQLPAIRELSWIMTKSPDRLDERETLVLKYLLSHPNVALVYSLLQRFHEMLRNRQPEPLADWLDTMKQTNLALLANFAKGLEQDFLAVEAAMTYSWSNGQTEGQVNRLKLIKRQMYGRSRFDLLRLRVLHSSHST